jgi:HK97 gp10 family phage protein
VPTRVTRANKGALRAQFRSDVERCERAKNEGAKVAASVARQLAPVDTGELRDLIALLYGPYGGVKLVSQAAHTIFVEFGTVNSDAQPFFRPAVEAGRKHMRKVLRRGR